MPSRTRSRGAAAVEVAIVIPRCGLLLTAVLVGWRIGWVRAQVAEAAAAGARAATIPNSATVARRQAAEAIERDLATVDVHCAGLQTDVDTAAFALPIGSAGQVTVRVVCPLDLSDAVIPGLPGQLVVAATASEPLDRFRERKP